MPVSLTLSSRCEFTRWSSTCTWPPFGVNLIALVSRFHTTCCRRAASALTMSRLAPKIAFRRMPLASGRWHGGVHGSFYDTRE